MKKSNIGNLKLLLSLIMFWAITAHAQKLPTVQLASVRAPANIKIDGKANEWDGTFQAHNNAMDISYTMANDDENLYLVIRAVDHDVINTIVGYGFTFVIQKSGKKDEKDKITIAYPVYSEKNNLGNIVPANYRKGVIPDTSSTITAAYNRLIQQKLKTIVVTGIAGMDTLSVYNDKGIKAIGLLNNIKNYTLELAVPLKYMGISANSASKFAYHMVINGYRAPEHYTIELPANATPEYIAGMQQAMADLNGKLARINASTDFWGEYTLAKK